MLRPSRDHDITNAHLIAQRDPPEAAQRATPALAQDILEVVCHPVLPFKMLDLIFRY